MPPLPRADCPRCRRTVAVRRGGELREHQDTGGAKCAASGTIPSNTETTEEHTMPKQSLSEAMAAANAAPTKAKAAKTAAPKTNGSAPGHPAGPWGGANALTLELDQVRAREVNRDDLGDLEGLAASIAELGVLEPILVTLAADSPAPDGPTANYDLVAGQRRLEASRKAGLTQVPALLRTETDARAEELRLVENLHRKDLTPLEEARGYHLLIERYGYSQTSIAKALHIGQPVVSKRLALLELPPTAVAALAAGDLGPAEAYEVARVAKAGGDVAEVMRAAKSGGLAGAERAARQQVTEAEERKATDKLAREAEAAGAKVVVRRGRFDNWGRDLLPLPDRYDEARAAGVTFGGMDLGLRSKLPAFADHAGEPCHGAALVPAQVGAGKVTTVVVWCCTEPHRHGIQSEAEVRKAQQTSVERQRAKADRERAKAAEKAARRAGVAGHLAVHPPTRPAMAEFVGAAYLEEMSYPDIDACELALTWFGLDEARREELLDGASTDHYTLVRAVAGDTLHAAYALCLAAAEVALAGWGGARLTSGTLPLWGCLYLEALTTDGDYKLTDDEAALLERSRTTDAEELARAKAAHQAPPGQDELTDAGVVDAPAGPTGDAALGNGAGNQESNETPPPPAGAGDLEAEVTEGGEKCPGSAKTAREGKSVGGKVGTCPTCLSRYETTPAGRVKAHVRGGAAL